MSQRLKQVVKKMIDSQVWDNQLIDKIIIHKLSKILNNKDNQRIHSRLGILVMLSLRMLNTRKIQS